MSSKRTIAAEVEAWIRREQSRAAECRAQAEAMERRARDSDRKALNLQAMLDASDFLNAPTADEEAGF